MNCRLFIEPAVVVWGKEVMNLFKGRNIRIALMIVVVAITTVAVQSAVAQSNGTGQSGWGASAQAVGPAGTSVRPDLAQRFEQQKQRIVGRLEDHPRIPPAVKDDLIARITSLFDSLIARFS